MLHVQSSAVAPAYTYPMVADSGWHAILTLPYLMVWQDKLEGVCNRLWLVLHVHSSAILPAYKIMFDSV